MGINAIAGGNESRRRQRELDRQERENQLWYDRRYNEVGRETQVGQRMLEKMREAQRERMASVSGKSAVMGGSNAVSAAESAAANKAIGDTVGKIDAQQEARQDAIEKDYRQTKRSISNARINASIADSKRKADAASQTSAMVGSLAMGLDGGSGKSSGIKSASAPSVDAQSGANTSSGVQKIQRVAAAYSQQPKVAGGVSLKENPASAGKKVFETPNLTEAYKRQQEEERKK